MALKDLLIICGGDFLIINWIEGLDRCFAGLQKSLTSIRSLKGERKYYEYRRTALPYIVWITENLNYRDLSSLSLDYESYILECSAGSSPEANYARLRNSLYNQSMSTILAADLETQLQAAQSIQSHPNMQKVDTPHYNTNAMQRGYGYRETGLPTQSQFSTMDPKDRTEYANAHRAYTLLTRKLGSVGLLYLLFKDAFNSGYPNGGVKQLWKSLPFATRFSTKMKVNRLFGQFFVKKYHGSYGINKMIDRLLEESGWEVTSDLGFRTGDVARIIKRYYSALWKYHTTVKTTLEEYDKSRKIYETLTPERITYMRTGLEQLRDAYRVLGIVGRLNPATDFRSGNRLGKIPTDLEYNNFEKTMKDLGFEPDLPTFEIEHCDKCSGKGGSSNRICNTCQGWGVVGLPSSVKHLIPKMMYSSQDVSSYKKQEALERGYNYIYGRLNFGRTEETDYQIESIDQMLTTLDLLEKGIKPKV